MSQKQNPNQRRNTRRTAFIIAEYSVKEGVFRDIIKNISPEGIYINTTRNIRAGQPILIKFPLFQFDEIVEVNGEVVRSSHTGFAAEFDRPIRGLVSKDGTPVDIVHEINRNP